MTYVANGNDKLVEAYQNPDGMITNYILGGSCVRELYRKCRLL